MVVASSASGGVIVFWLASYAGAIYVSVRLGRRRNRTGWPWGVFLGWIGVIILALMRNKVVVTPVQAEIAQLEEQVKLAQLRRALEAQNQ